MRNAIDIFHSLQREASAAELSLLRDEVKAHLESLLKAQQKSELLAIDLAELLAARLDVLLQQAGSMSIEHRSAVVGAARYFVSENDEVPDAHSCTGLDDDVRVFNHVVALLGRVDLRITDE
jgi:uncharacterized membrane protein YkvA (DUF1232 family)